MRDFSLWRDIGLNEVIPDGTRVYVRPLRCEAEVLSRQDHPFGEPIYLVQTDSFFRTQFLAREMMVKR